LAHDLLIRSGQNRHATGIANEFICAFDHAMPFAGLTAHNLPGRGHLESLLSPRFSLELGHFAYPF